MQSPSQKPQSPDSTTAQHTAADAKPNVSVEWLHDRQIVIFSVNAVASRAVVDEWADIVAGVIKSWPADKIYLAMHDLSDKRVTPTPYARARVREFDELVKRLHGRIAIVLPNNFAGHLIRIFLTTMRWQQKLPTEGFLSYETGLEWLEKALPARESTVQTTHSTKS
jgi:hypothetical protein